MGKVKKDHKLLAALLGLSFDKKSKTIYGQKDGFSVIVRDSSSNKSNRFFMIVSAKPTSDEITLKDIRQFTDVNPFASLELKPNQILMVFESNQYPEQLYQDLRQSVNALIGLLQSKRFEPCCASCGQNVETSVYSVSDSYGSLCPACIGRIRVNIAYDKQQKHENIPGGVAGAFIGSVIGMILLLFFLRLKIFPLLLGFITSICTFKGYELLGKKMTKKGMIISTVMVLFTTYVSNRMDWAIVAATQLDIDIFTAFRIVPYLLKEGLIDTFTFVFNLLGLSISTIGGAVAIIWAELREGKITKIGP